MLRLLAHIRAYFISRVYHKNAPHTSGANYLIFNDIKASHQKQESHQKMDFGGVFILERKNAPCTITTVVQP